MLGRENKYGSIFSWADEVEKEEEEEAAAAARAGEGAAGGGQVQQQQRQKPNPFGSARPREVILQEKGIDWRKLDFHLHRRSPLRHEPENEKPRRQSNSQSKTTILNDKEPYTPPRFRRSPASSQVILTPHIQSPILFVPPLRYPPKFVAGVLYEPWLSVSLNAPNSGPQHFKHEKENRFHEGRKAHNFMSDSAMSENRRGTAAELVQSKEAHRKGRNLEESIVRGNKPRAVSATRKEKLRVRNSLRLPLTNKKIGPYEVRDKRMHGIANQPMDEQDELHMGVTAFQVSQNSKAEEVKWQKMTRNVQDLSAKQVNNGGRSTTRGKIKGERANMGRNNNKKFEKKQFKFKS